MRFFLVVGRERFYGFGSLAKVAINQTTKPPQPPGFCALAQTLIAKRFASLFLRDIRIREFMRCLSRHQARDISRFD